MTMSKWIAWMPRDGRPGHVYLIDLGNGLYKIGRSTDPKKRLKDFRTTNPEARIIANGLVGHNTRTEYELHMLYSGKRVAGEIYRLEPTDIDWICDQIAVASRDYQTRAANRRETL